MSDVRPHHLPLLRRRLRRARDAAAPTAPSRSRAIPSIPPTSAGCARRARRSARRCRSTTGCCIRMVDGERASWDAALDLVAQRFRRRSPSTGPTASPSTSPARSLTEDYYVANKLMKGFIGSANIDTNSRLCMASSVAGHKRAFGSDTVPGTYEDLELADLVVLVGSNLAWCHPVLYQRLAAAREKRGTKVVVDRSAPHGDLRDRRPASADRAGHRRRAVQRAADAHRRRQRRRSRVSSTRIRRASARRMRAAREHEHQRGRARRPGISQLELFRFYDLFVGTPARRHGLQPGRQPVGAPAPTRSTRSSIAISRPAASASRAWGRSPSPASPTRWAAARSAASPTCSPRTWSSTTPEHRAHRAAVLASPRHRRQARPQGRRHVPRGRRRPHQGDLDHGDQPGRQHAGGRRRARSARPLPVRRRLRRDAPHRYDGACACAAAVARLGREGRHRHQLRAPHLAPARVPAAAGRSARRTGGSSPRSRKRMGFAERSIGPVRPRSSPSTRADRHRERRHARSRHRRAAPISTTTTTTTLAPFQWPRPQAAPRARRASSPTAASSRRTAGPASCRRRWRAADRRPVPSYPLVLNTGRIRDQWHTMTRTAKTARLMSHIAEPFVEVHPDDAARYGLEAAALARVRARTARAIVRVARDRPAAPRLGVRADALDRSVRQQRARRCADRARDVDPVSGQPELKAHAGRDRAVRGRLVWLCRQRAKPAATPMRTIGHSHRARSGWRIELAGAECRDDWTELRAHAADGQRTHRRRRGARLSRRRTAPAPLRRIRWRRLLGALFVAPRAGRRSRAPGSPTSSTLRSTTPAERLAPAGGRRRRHRRIAARSSAPASRSASTRSPTPRLRASAPPSTPSARA